MSIQINYKIWSHVEVKGEENLMKVHMREDNYWKSMPSNFFFCSLYFASILTLGSLTRCSTNSLIASNGWIRLGCVSIYNSIRAGLRPSCVDYKINQYLNIITNNSYHLKKKLQNKIGSYQVFCMVNERKWPTNMFANGTIGLFVSIRVLTPWVPPKSVQHEELWISLSVTLLWCGGGLQFFQTSKSFHSTYLIA